MLEHTVYPGKTIHWVSVSRPCMFKLKIYSHRLKTFCCFSGHAVNAFWWSTLNYLCLFYSYNQTYNLNGIEIPCRLNHIPLIVDLSSSRIGFPPHVSSPPRRVARSLVSRWRHTLLSNRWLVFPTRVFLRQVLRSDCV